MHPPSSPVRRSSRSTRGVTSKFSDYMTGDELDISTLSTPCSMCHAPVRTQQLAPYYVQSMACGSQLPTPAQGLAQSYQYPAYQPYQYQPYLPFNAHCDQFNQQCNPQSMGPVISPTENTVFVSDGFSWNEYNLENVFSG
jgi:hypothetical protein